MVKVGSINYTERIPLDELPETFRGTVSTVEFKVDGMGRECLYMNIQVGDKMVTQKWTPAQIAKYLDPQLTKMGIEEYEDMELKPFIFKKMSGELMGEPLRNGRRTMPRWLPHPIVKRGSRKKKEEPAE